MAKGKGKGVGEVLANTFGRMLKGMEGAAKQMLEFANPSRKVNRHTIGASVVQRWGVSIWELYNTTTGKKILVVKENDNGLRISAGADKPSLEFVDGEWWVVISKSENDIAEAAR